LKIKDLLTSENKWTKETYARDSQGRPALPHDERAVCWCLEGALFKCYPTSQYVDIINKVRKYLGTKDFEPIAIFNDSPRTTFEDIAKLVETLDI
jgi:hypothetical protein